MGTRVPEIEGNAYLGCAAVRTVPAYHWVRMASHRDIPGNAAYKCSRDSFREGAVWSPSDQTPIDKYFVTFRNI